MKRILLILTAGLLLLIALSLMAACARDPEPAFTGIPGRTDPPAVTTTASDAPVTGGTTPKPTETTASPVTTTTNRGEDTRPPAVSTTKPSETTPKPGTSTLTPPAVTTTPAPVTTTVTVQIGDGDNNSDWGDLVPMVTTQ